MKNKSYLTIILSRDYGYYRAFPNCDPSICRPFVQKLLKTDELPPKIKVSVYRKDQKTKGCHKISRRASGWRAIHYKGQCFGVTIAQSEIMDAITNYGLNMWIKIEPA